MIVFFLEDGTEGLRGGLGEGVPRLRHCGRSMEIMHGDVFLYLRSECTKGLRGGLDLRPGRAVRCCGRSCGGERIEDAGRKMHRWRTRTLVEV